jgi:hypothetical protein
MGGHVACMGETRLHTIFWLENLKGIDHFGDLSVDGKIMNLREIEWKGVD